jgi:hypothetical protein
VQRAGEYLLRMMNNHALAGRTGWPDEVMLG